MNQSFFAAIRLTVMLLTIDGKVTPAERDWFRRLENSLPFSKVEKAILRGDLKATATFKQVTELFYLITDPEDRARLLKLLRAAMAVDGESNHHNTQLYQHIVILNQSPALETHHFAREGVNAQTSLAVENQRWAEFEKSAIRFREESTPSYGHLGKTGFLTTLFNYFPGTKYLFFLLVLLATTFSILTECRYYPRYRYRRTRFHYGLLIPAAHGRTRSERFRRPSLTTLGLCGNSESL